jgi:hypothetical protein
VKIRYRWGGVVHEGYFYSSPETMLDTGGDFQMIFVQPSPTGTGEGQWIDVQSVLPDPDSADLPPTLKPQSQDTYAA